MEIKEVVEGEEEGPLYDDPLQIVEESPGEETDELGNSNIEPYSTIR